MYKHNWLCVFLVNKKDAARVWGRAVQLSGVLGVPFNICVRCRVCFACKASVTAKRDACWIITGPVLVLAVGKVCIIKIVQGLCQYSVYGAFAIK